MVSVLSRRWSNVVQRCVRFVSDLNGSTTGAGAQALFWVEATE